MKTQGQDAYSFIDKSGRLDEAQLEQDIDNIRELYQDHGYIDVEVKDVRERNAREGTMVLTIVVAEGPQYHVGKLTITGYKTTTEQKIRALLKMKEGSVYSPKQIARRCQGGRRCVWQWRLCRSRGHRRRERPAGPARSTSHYNIEEGVRSFVQRINIVGNTRTKDKVIRREVLSRLATSLTPSGSTSTKKRLDNLGYFSKVETYPEDTGVPGRKDLTIQVRGKTDRIAQFRRRLQHGRSVWSGSPNSPRAISIFSNWPHLPAAAKNSGSASSTARSEKISFFP